MMRNILVEEIIGREVVVSIDSLRVQGKLVHYTPSQKVPYHKPEALILKDESNRFLILRNWDKIEALPWQTSK